MTVKHNIRWEDRLDKAKEVKLERFVLGVATRLSMLEFDSVLDAIVFKDHIELKIRRYLMIETHGPDPIEVTYPKTWWQHLKQALLEKPWSPLWARRLINNKYPVEYTTRMIDVKIAYPKIHPQIPNIEYMIVLSDLGIREEKDSEQT